MTKISRRILTAAIASLALIACTDAGKTAPGGTLSIASSKGAPDGIGFVVGQETAPVTLIEYASPTCPACLYFHTDVAPKLKEKYVDTGKVKLVFRPFPIHGEVDVALFRLAMCGGESKFFAIVDDIFKNQDGVIAAANSGALKASLETIGGRHGLDAAKVDTCMKDASIRDVLAASYDAANRDKVASTPSFVLNGKLVETKANSVDALSKEIDAVLAASGGK